MRDTCGILAEIGTRLAGKRAAAQERGGQPLLAPLLMLGTMERVGSNWLSDTLRVLLPQHNEPLRQQLAPDHPLSPLNPCPVGVAEAGRRLPPYGWHWLITTVVSKYDTTRHVIKETNLFFALPSLLELFPHSPVVVLTRSPLGVASSFVRGNLFSRWDYRARYRQMVTTTYSSDTLLTGAATLVPDDAPADLVALVRLHVLNTVLLATALDARTNPADDGDGQVACISYEEAVRNPGTTWRSLVRVLPELAGADRPQTAQDDSAQAAARAEDTFVTTAPKTALTASLDDACAELVRLTTMQALATVQRSFPPRIAAQARKWLAGDHLYTLSPPSPRPASSRISTAPACAAEVAFVPGKDGLRWRNLLVTNAEFAAFLNEMAEAGLPNSQSGTHLLCCEMPHERGGRLHRCVNGGWAASPGFEDHPAYWVTWIGAAAFAARHGARLPLRAEMTHLMAGAQATNTDYAVGDTVAVVQGDLAADAIHHLLGNVQVWCADGPDPAGGPVARWLTGAAWNTPSAWEEVIRPRHRHLVGSSRGIGIRLIADAPDRPMPVDLVAGLLQEWMNGLAERSLPLHVLDGRLVTAFTRSQADVGLGAHVRACSRPAGLGELDEPRGEAQLGQVSQGHKLHTADRRGIGARRDVAHGAACAGGLERDVHDVGVAAGQVVAHVQQPPHHDVEAGLLAHLTREGVADGLALFDLPAGQGVRPAGVSVLVKEQDPAVLDEHAGDSYLHHLRTVSQPLAPGGAFEQARVVVAAGGLGSRVQEWARYLPKEWMPVQGRPGIVHLLDEISVLGPALVVIVYHPYYEPFVSWARQALTGGAERYLQAADLPLPGERSIAEMTVEWMAQKGAYGDLTSLLNGVDHLGSEGGQVYVAFGDNLYPTVNPLKQLSSALPGVTVLGRPYQAELASSRGVMATEAGPHGRRVIELVEKPSAHTAQELEARYGAGNLLLVEGRARVDGEFVDYARSRRWPDGVEPRLSLVLGGWARTRAVHVVTTASMVVNLGMPIG